MAANQKIVVSGVGVVSPLGIGLDPFWSALCEGRSGVRALPLFDDPGLPVRMGGEVADFDPKQYVRPRKSLKVMSRDIQLAFAAADMACADAKISEASLNPERFGVILGADMMPGELDELIGTYRHCIVDGRFDFHLWGEAFTAELFPLWMLKYLPNMPACHIGIAQDARGPNNTLTLGDVSSLSAIIEAVRVLDRGQADLLIAGGVGVRIHPILWMRGLLSYQSRQSDDPASAMRPFDARRDGLVMGEGSATFILEKEADARARGGKVLARVLGHACVYQPPRSDRSFLGEAMRRCIAAAMDGAGLKPSELGFVVAHGLGVVEDDRIEAQAIRDVLGDVPVTASKGGHGFLGAGAGSLEAALCLPAFCHGLVPPTCNYQQPDPQCPINVVHGEPSRMREPTALVLSYSWQGHAVALVLGAG